jgi:hypothetical protein
VDEFRGIALGHFVEFIRKEWTVGIIRGESANFREPLDLVDVQGRYSGIFPKV